MNALETPEAPADVIDTSPSYVLTHASLGIYLGSVEMIAHYWSKATKVGHPPSAPTWSTEAKALDFAAKYLHTPVQPHEVQADTEHDGRPHATPAACEAAGLEPWVFDPVAWGS